jgi:acyl dehydratase
MIKYYFDDFRVGQVFDIGPRHVGREEIIAFAEKYDPQPFHIDETAAKQTMFGGLIASGWHTAAICMRMSVDGLIGMAASLGSPGVDETRWLKPVRPGDDLRLRIEVLEVTPSRSKPDRGTIRILWTMTNQKQEAVLTMKGLGMYARRPAAA